MSGLVDALHRAEHAHVLTNGEPRPVGELLISMCRASNVHPPQWSLPAGIARAAGSLIERAWALRPGTDEPPMARFLAEQLSTMSIDEGLQ